jgi:hypothetical protein
LGLVVGLAGCSTKLDMAAIDKSVKEGLSSQLSLPIASVACPQEPMVAKAGATFECTATPEVGGKLTIKVTEKDDAGNIAWEVTKTEGLLDLQKVEQAVAAGIAEQTGAESTVSCGGRWRAAQAGDSFDCQATAADGATSTVTVTSKDADGNIDWALGSDAGIDAPSTGV